MTREIDVHLDDGRTLHAYDTESSTTADRLAVFWHHGTPNLGIPPEPLMPAADRLGIRWVSYDRPGYGGSTPHEGRDVASAANDAARVADALGIDRFAVLGHSGGGPHALACGAALPDRVLGVVSVAGPAPIDSPGLDWFADMIPSGVASLRAATEGRAAKERYETSGADYDPGFSAADREALAGPWAWFDEVVGPAVAAGPGGLIDDDLALVAPWGFDPATMTAPVLLLHGGRDRIVPAAHGRWLASQCRTADLWFSADDGHISILNSAPAAMKWLREHAG